MDDLLVKIDEVKEKLTSQEYMDLMTALQRVHNTTDTEKNFSKRAKEIIESIPIYWVGEILVHQIAAFNTFVYENCSNPPLIPIGSMRMDDFHQMYNDFGPSRVRDLENQNAGPASLLLERFEACSREYYRVKATNAKVLSKTFESIVRRRKDEIRRMKD